MDDKSTPLTVPPPRNNEADIYGAFWKESMLSAVPILELMRLVMDLR